MVTATANSVLTNSWHSGRNVDDYVYKVYAQPSVKTLKWDKNKEPKSILVIALSWHFTDFSCLFSDFITSPTDKPCGTQQSLEICVYAICTGLCWRQVDWCGSLWPNCCQSPFTAHSFTHWDQITNNSANLSCCWFLVADQRPVNTAEEAWWGQNNWTHCRPHAHHTSDVFQ